MWREFKSFLIKQNALALAIAVVIGAALSDVVKSLVDNIIMPIVGYATPGGDWRAATFNVGPVRFGIGAVAGALLNFLIIGLVAWRLSRMFLPRVGEKPASKTCPHCRMGDVDLAATRCPHCTSQLAG